MEIKEENGVDERESPLWGPGVSGCCEGRARLCQLRSAACMGLKALRSPPGQCSLKDIPASMKTSSETAQKRD